MVLDKKNAAHLKEVLYEHGLRSTRQREVVYAVLVSHRDHPNAEKIYARAKQHMPGISVATVYNCLQTLHECGLVRQVNLKRQATRFCPEWDDHAERHAHFHCTNTGKVHDIELTPEILETLRSLLPDGYDAEEMELSFRGKIAREKAFSAAI